MNTKNKFLPIAFALVLITGIFLGSKLSNTLVGIPAKSSTGQFTKLNSLLNYIQNEYVDTVNSKDLVENTIENLLSNLDPHSAYIPAEELASANESLEGNFEGIGVEFHILNDTILVVSPISGGPSEIAGIQAGDRIVIIEKENVAGKGIKNNEVMKKLRGQGGTKVKVGILRRGEKGVLYFTITRGKIPLYSVDVSYMVNENTGFIKVSRFGASTYEEYMEAFEKLKKRGMTQLILDLRGNPGGYLNSAISLADEFLEDKKMIVYTEGKAHAKEVYNATKTGLFEKGKLVLLIDEGSASASEIVAGALQDWDRAYIIGRRSFGKGLVQEQSVFPDGSAVRLTIARYYTPTGRSIQKPYKAGLEQYNNELYDRYKHGEFESADSVRFSDTLKYKTPAGKTVYGGGGIMPDIFVAIDTSGTSSLSSAVFRNGLISSFSYNYVDRNRKKIKSFETPENYKNKFTVNSELFQEFINDVKESGIKVDENDLKISSPLLKMQLKAYIARLIWKEEGFYPIINSEDKVFLKALETLEKPL